MTLGKLANLVKNNKILKVAEIEKARISTFRLTWYEPPKWQVLGVWVSVVCAFRVWVR